MDKKQIPLKALVEEYLAVCRTEGKSPKTLSGYKEKRSRFCCWLKGTLGDFSLQMVRAYVAELQGTKKFQGHPYTPAQHQPLST